MSRRLIAVESLGGSEEVRTSYMIDNMKFNRAYVTARSNCDDSDGSLLRLFQSKYLEYRRSWHNRSREIFEQGMGGEDGPLGGGPLCVDIEVAAICDLACPFCYRQFVATPDKLIEDTLAYRLIDQAVELGVPSLKFNWRGEPLMNPKLPRYIAYAKERGVLETIINTNATRLTDQLSRDLISAGLDFMIYSFDGGTRESYERLRPGRFSKNSFDSVYDNIKNFARVREEVGSPFPRTKIQMVLTRETFNEQSDFLELFQGIVDEVSVKQYTERGGALEELNEIDRLRLQDEFRARGLPDSTPFFRDRDGDFFIAVGRLPCEQPFQRMLATYDGRVAMCCYDWGAQHPIGYVDGRALNDGDKEYKSVVEKARRGDKNFILLKSIELPRVYNSPDPKVDDLNTLWNGKEINLVRRAHMVGKVDSVDICRSCPFKETYSWEKI